MYKFELIKKYPSVFKTKEGEACDSFYVNLPSKFKQLNVPEAEHLIGQYLIYRKSVILHNRKQLQQNFKKIHKSPIFGIYGTIGNRTKVSRLWVQIDKSNLYILIDYKLSTYIEQDIYYKLERILNQKVELRFVKSAALNQFIPQRVSIILGYEELRTIPSFATWLKNLYF